MPCSLLGYHSALFSDKRSNTRGRPCNLKIYNATFLLFNLPLFGPALFAVHKNPIVSVLLSRNFLWCPIGIDFVCLFKWHVFIVTTLKATLSLNDAIDNFLFDLASKKLF